jgi:hypothetical protein
MSATPFQWLAFVVLLAIIVFSAFGAAAGPM